MESQQSVQVRLRRVDDAIALVEQARRCGVSADESATLAVVERQALIFVGFLKDIEQGRVALDDGEQGQVFKQVDQFCDAVEEAMQVANGSGA